VNEHKSAHLQASPLLKKVQPPSPALDASTPLVEAPVSETKACCTSAQSAILWVPEVIEMGMVVMTYKVNPDSDLQDVDTDAIAETIATLRNDDYDIQAIETKPLAFGLKFVQVHVKMNDGEGLADAFEAQMSEIHGVGEIEVLSMGLI